MRTPHKFTAVHGVVEVVLERPVADGSIFAGDLHPVMMAMMAGGHIFGKLALHRGKHAVAAFIASAGRIVDEDKVIGKAGAQAVPVLCIKAIPIIRLQLFYSADVLLDLYPPCIIE